MLARSTAASLGCATRQQLLDMEVETEFMAKMAAGLATGNGRVDQLTTQLPR